VPRSDGSFLKTQADRCRRLARSTTDERTARILNDMADEYQAKADRLDSN